MVVLKSSNRFLTKVEIEFALKNLMYDDAILEEILKKNGFSKEFIWKNTDMDMMQEMVNKERKHLSNLAMVCAFRHRQLLRKHLYNAKNENNIFFNNQKFFQFELKIRKLLNMIKILDFNCDIALDILDKSFKKRSKYI